MPQPTLPIFQKKPTVFISYAHEGDLSNQVQKLADWLGKYDVDVITDSLIKPPPEGWRIWMQRSIKQANITLMVCTERYKTLFDKDEISDAGGRGVTWEAGLISGELQESKLFNERFFPIVPDGGSSEHIPQILRDWAYDYWFPSNQERILDLVKDGYMDQVPNHSQPTLAAQLKGPSDNRLLPREIEIIGRDNEIEQVVAFLNGAQSSASVSGYVAGSGGIGKTELCKAALRKWLQDNPDETAYW